MSSSGTFVSKRFLAGMNGDYVNADHIIRLYWSAGKLMAAMASGTDIELKPRAYFTSPQPDAPYPSPVEVVEMVSF